MDTGIIRLNAGADWDRDYEAGADSGNGVFSRGSSIWPSISCDLVYIHAAYFDRIPMRNAIVAGADT